MKRTRAWWGLLSGLLLSSPAVVGAAPPNLVGNQTFDLVSSQVIVADGEVLQVLSGSLSVEVYRLGPAAVPPDPITPPNPIRYLVRTRLDDLVAQDVDSGRFYTAHGVVTDVITPPSPISPVALVGFTQLVPPNPIIPPDPITPPNPVRLLFRYDLFFGLESVGIEGLQIGDSVIDVDQP